MKIHFITLFSALVMGLGACKQNNNKASQQNNLTADTLQTKSLNKISTKDFDLQQVPVSQKEIGEFPYLSVPTGYRLVGEKEKTLEQKYFFYNDSLVNKVSGQYYHAKVFQEEGKVFEETFLVNSYQKMIEELGGKEFYSGGIPALAAELIDKEKPAYAADMYDPKPYKYKQFLIRTPKQNIWIELCYGLNAPQIDLTVVREEHINE